MPYKFIDIFETPNLIITFTNILFFIIVQIWFFKNFASQQVDTVLKNKLHIVSTYLNYDLDSKKNILEKIKKINEDYKKYIEFKNKGESDEKIFSRLPELKNNIKRLSIKNKQWRNDENWKSIKSKLGPIIIGLLIVIFISIIYQIFISKTPWRNKDGGFFSVNTSLFILILGAFTTEILFYLGMVKQYIYYGDHDIYERLYSDLRNNYMFKPKLDLLNLNIKDGKTIKELEKELDGEIDKIYDKLLTDKDIHDDVLALLDTKKQEYTQTIRENSYINNIEKIYQELSDQYNNKDLIISKYNEVKDNFNEVKDNIPNVKVNLN